MAQPEHGKGQKARRTISVIGLTLLLFLAAVLLYPDPLINGLLKPRILSAFSSAFPNDTLTVGRMHYNVFTNRLRADSITVRTNAPAYSGTIHAFSLQGIRWLRLLNPGSAAPEILADARIEADSLSMSGTRTSYLARCGSLMFSLPDSTLLIDSFHIRPRITDEEFFARSKYRQTRYEMKIPSLTVSGIDAGKLFHGKFHATTIRADRASLDVLVDKEKPYNERSPLPIMPGRFLASKRDTVSADSIIFSKSRVEYNERSIVGVPPAAMIADHIHLTGIWNYNHDRSTASIAITARGDIMGASPFDIALSLPVSKNNVSFSLEGKQSPVPLEKFNRWVETDQHIRIKSGVLDTLSFHAQASEGAATGEVHARYSDLTIAAMDPRTKSESGLAKSIASTIANELKLRTSNPADSSEPAKIGHILYVKQPGDTFLQFVWFALRSGLGEIVGF